MGLIPLPTTTVQTTNTSIIEEDPEKKKTAIFPTKMEFRSEFIGKTTHIKFDEKKIEESNLNKSDLEGNPEEKSFEVSNRPTLKKATTNFCHENEDIMNESGNLKKYLKSHESNL